jgi:hypothetical protein
MVRGVLGRIGHANAALAEEVGPIARSECTGSGGYAERHLDDAVRPQV